MDGSEKIVNLLECLIQVIGRVAMPVEKVQEIVGTTPKHIKAFNMCDGTRTQTEVAKQVGVQQGNLSRVCERWVKNGVAFWVGEGQEARLLHIYPIPQGKDRKRPKGGKRGKQ
ncbi:MAG: hypothetical protein AMXMBFR83_05880 [Phycisphaerae bacterium]|jgi:hypothetical protein